MTTSNVPRAVQAAPRGRRRPQAHRCGRAHAAAAGSRSTPTTNAVGISACRCDAIAPGAGAEIDRPARARQEPRRRDLRAPRSGGAGRRRRDRGAASLPQNSTRPVIQPDGSPCSRRCNHCSSVERVGRRGNELGGLLGRRDAPGHDEAAVPPRCRALRPSQSTVAHALPGPSRVAGMLSAKGVTVSLGGRLVLNEVSVSVAAGGPARHRRTERDRQDDAAARARGPGGARRGRGRAGAGVAHRRLPAPGDRRPAGRDAARVPRAPYRRGRRGRRAGPTDGRTRDRPGRDRGVHGRARAVSRARWRRPGRARSAPSARTSASPRTGWTWRSRCSRAGRRPAPRSPPSC